MWPQRGGRRPPGSLQSRSRHQRHPVPRPTLPNRPGSPPFKRTTSKPRRLLTRWSLISLADRWPKAFLAHADKFGLLRRAPAPRCRPSGHTPPRRPRESSVALSSSTALGHRGRPGSCNAPLGRRQLLMLGEATEAQFEVLLRNPGMRQL